jgi:hypothetical protein
MPTFVPGNAISSGTAPITGVTPLPTDAVPLPMPIAPGEPNPAGDTRLRMVTGGEGDDVLVVGGGAAFGGGGDDTFVLTSIGEDLDGPEHLGIIMDLQAGDKLDLSQLGDKAAELGREADGKGGERVSIDFDGDGKEDGFVIVHERGEVAPDDTGVISPPLDGEFHILPFPMPGDGEFHILPYPMPTDGPVTIMPVAFGIADSGMAGEAVTVLRTMSIDWIA